MATVLEANLDVNDIFVSLVHDDTREQHIFGGSSSGKSYFIIGQRMILDLLGGKRNYLCVRNVARTLRDSVYNEAVKAIYREGWGELFNINKTDMTITCVQNGCQAILKGLDDVEKVKSITQKKGVITDLLIEEATETDKSTVRNLYKRQRGGDADTPKRVTLSFNPIMQTNWIYEEYFTSIGWEEDQTEYASDDLTIMKTWYIHNRFLTADDIKDLESETDTYFYEVYTLGNWGILGNVIFTNWTMRDLSDTYDQFTRRRNGLDFGFSADPAALVVTHYDRAKKTIYIFNELYESGLTNDLLAIDVKEMIGNDRVVCDSAEPKSIAELVRDGVGATGAKKGKDSVIYGIQWLQQQNIIIDTRCINTRNEFMQYQFKEDRAGNAMRQPVEKNDHIIAALRYAYEDDMDATWWIN